MGAEYSGSVGIKDGTWLEYNNFIVINHPYSDNTGSPVPPRVGGFQRGLNVGYVSEAYFRYDDNFPSAPFPWNPGWYCQGCNLQLRIGSTNIQGQTVTINAYYQDRRQHDQWNQPPWGARSPQFDDFPPVNGIWGSLIGSVTVAVPVVDANVFIPIASGFIEGWFNGLKNPLDGIVLSCNTGFFSYFIEVKSCAVNFNVYSPDIATLSDRYFRGLRA